MNLKDVLAAKGRPRIVTVSAKSSIADAIRTMHAEKVGAVMVPDAAGWPRRHLHRARRGAPLCRRRPRFRHAAGRGAMTCSVVLGRLSMPVDEALA